MANVKITDLTAYTDAASTDVMPIVDVTNDVTKKISVSDLLKAAPTGTAAAPGIAFDGDPNTGIYSPGADQVAISTGGSGRLFISSTGNVGFNVSSPTQARLVVASSTGVNTGYFTDGTNSTIKFTHGSGGAIITTESGQFLGFGTSDQERLRITSAGLVGIGTTPGQILDIQSSGLAIARIRGGTGSGQSASFYVAAAGTGNTLAAFGDRASAFGGTVDQAASIYTAPSTPLTFDIGASEKVRITSAGLVGVGTSAPTVRLQVQDSIAGGSDGTVATLHNFSDAGGDARYVGLNFRIGSDNGTSAIRAARTLSAVDYRTELSFWTNPTGATQTPVRAMTIDYLQRVGIGTATVDERLHIVGNFKGVDSSGRGVQIINGATPYIQSLGTSNINDLQVLAQTIQFQTGTTYSTTERARIDSSGRLLLGTSTARANFFNSTFSAELQVEGQTSNDAATAVIRSSLDSAGPIVHLAKSRSSTVGGNGLVASGDQIGVVSFQGSDGTEFVPAAYIEAFADGTPGANDMPGRLVFSTTADGASSPTERMRIQSNGDLRIANATTFYPATDNAVAIGANVLRFSVVYAVNGTIQTSDEREKTNVADSSLGIDFIKSLRPVSYKWIEGGKRATEERDDDNNYIYESVPGERTHWGFIAQEVKQAVDAAGVDFGGWVLTDKDDPNSQQALRYDQFIAPLTKALQEALEKIETLEAKVAALESA